MSKKETGMLVDGVFASEAVDSSGEILSIKGMDISTFEEGKGLANHEHLGSDSSGFGQEIVGKVVYAKKILNKDDCIDDRQRMFWNRTKLPFLYGVVRLYDGAGHDGAKAIAASIRDSVANDEPIIIGFSIEGSILDRDGHKLNTSIARLVAMTSKPCNKQATSGIISDPHAPEGYDVNPEKTQNVHKSNIQDPLHARLGGSETEYGVGMLKTLTAGSYDAAPGALTGGAALQREDKSLKAAVLAARRDWPKTGKFKDYLKKYLEKSNLGDVDDDFLNHYSDIVESHHFRVKKSEEVIASLKKAGKPIAKTKAPAPDLGLTNGGEPVKPNTKLKEPSFDEKKGMLHLPEGSFKVYVPSHDTPEMASKFHEIMNDPKVEQFHGYAMENWAKAHKMLKAGTLPPEVAMHSVLFSNLSPNCLDSETEALTQRGWVRGFDLTSTDVLLTKNATTGELEWQKPTDLRMFPDYSGDLIKISSRSFEVVTTPDHRWLIDSNRGHVKEKTSKTLVVADKIHRTGNYVGPVQSGLTPDEAELLGWFVTDGYWSKAAACTNSNSSKYELSGLYARLCQSTTGNPQKCERIDALVSRLSDEASSYVGADGKKVWTVGPALTSMLHSRAPDRHLTVTSLLDLSREALARLAEGMYLGDGNNWTNTAKSWKTKLQLTTGRKEQAEAFQVLLTMLGYASSCVWRDMSKYSPQSSKMKNVPKMTGVYVVTQLGRKFVSFNPKSRTEFVDKVGVWCPVVPNTFFVARRKGQVFVTGNTPVPMQELMFGKLVDSMNQTGKNPLHPDWGSVKQDWLERDEPQKFPDHSPEHWKRLEGSLRLKNDSKTTGRVKGDIGSFMLASSKFDNMSKYSKMHDKLQDLIQRHRGDARSAAEEMMYHKGEQGKWEQRRRIGLGSGKSDIGEYPGMSISGLAPKTTRYALGMMGGGNVTVPDTHFVRNLFGLNRNLDGKSIDAIKKHLWNDKNAHLLNGIDRYYANNHDAVKHMLNHPKWGSTFEKPEDAVFPAFWKHWMGILPHEQARGHQVNGYNELTDHRPFWEAIAPYTKSETSNIPMETAKQQADWQQQYGEMPAQMLYYRYLLPKLLAHAGAREAQSLIRKAQAIQIEVLAKDDSSGFSPVGTKTLSASEPEHVTFQGRKVKPGYSINEKNGTGYHLLGHSPSHFYGIPQSMDYSKGWNESDLVKIPREADSHKIYSYPESVDDPNVVHADNHGVENFTSHEGSRKLAHGFDFSGPRIDSDSGAFANTSFWAKTPSGSKAYVKAAADHEGFAGNAKAEGRWNTARKEGVYHNLAHDYFGLGHMVPNVAVVREPKTGREHALVENVKNASHVDELGSRETTRSLARANENGDVHKAAMMNVILNNADRHDGNYLLGHSGGQHNKLHLIDHNLWGSNRLGAGVNVPFYVSKLNGAGEGHDPAGLAHPEAQKWLKSLDPSELRSQLMRYGAPPNAIENSLTRLNQLKKHVGDRKLYPLLKMAHDDSEI